jgi:hypothetical protein
MAILLVSINALFVAALAGAFSIFTAVATMIGSAGIIFLLMDQSAKWLFFTTRVYAWLDQEDRLHIHESSWWRDLASNKTEVQKRIPKSNVLSLWLGPWPGRSKVLGDNSLFWKVKVSGKWTFWPSPIRDLVFRDCTGCSSRIPLISKNSRDIAWEWDRLSLVLKTIDRHQCLGSILSEIVSSQRELAASIAGKVGTAG